MRITKALTKQLAETKSAEFSYHKPAYVYTSRSEMRTGWTKAFYYVHKQGLEPQLFDTVKEAYGYLETL